jgi:hypothetical protein
MRTRRGRRPGETRFKLFTAATFYCPTARITAMDIPHDAGDVRLLDRQVVDTLAVIVNRAGGVQGVDPLDAWQSRKRKDDGLPLCRSAGGVPTSTPPPTTRRAGLLPRGVLVDVLRDFAGQLTPTGATLPPSGRILALLCQVIEHEALGIGMIVKGLKLRASLNLHHARIAYALMTIGADELFCLHALHHRSISCHQHVHHQKAPFSLASSVACRADGTTVARE